MGNLTRQARGPGIELTSVYIGLRAEYGYYVEETTPLKCITKTHSRRRVKPLESVVGGHNKA